MKKTLSVIIPMKNEEDGIGLLFAKLLPILGSITTLDYEIVIVNDGSTDSTLDVLLDKQMPKLKIVDLSRNFGKEAALVAGFAHCSGDCAIAIDADLQDPPELITTMVEEWLKGYEVVTAVHNFRQSDGYVKRQTASLFYKIMNQISEPKLVQHAGDFRLLDRSAIEAFLRLPERVRFNKGLFAWIGFKEKLVYHERAKRESGSTKWSYFKLFKFSLDGITSFSTAPLKIWTYLGMLTSLSGFLYAVYYLIKTLVFGIDVHGYPSLLIFILVFSGLQMMGIGIMGEYIGRIFIESKQRPLYIIRNIHENKS